jgi:acylphosphatase
MVEIHALRFLISGRVQGVFFRGATQTQAQHLGLRGYARNLADGRVEVLAAGAPEALAELAHWLHRGPPQARVDGVERLPADAGELPAGFEVRRG